MSTIGKIRSNAIGVYISNTEGDTLAGATAPTGGTYGDATFEEDTFELIACATNGTFSGSMEVLDATTKDNDGQREVLPGGLTWSMTAEGLIQYNLENTVKSNIDLFDLWQNKTLLRLAWTTGKEGDVMYYGNAYITQFEENAGLNEIASFSVTFEGDGAITKALVNASGTGLQFNTNDD